MTSFRIIYIKACTQLPSDDIDFLRQLKKENVVQSQMTYPSLPLAKMVFDAADVESDIKLFILEEEEVKEGHAEFHYPKSLHCHKDAFYQNRANSELITLDLSQSGIKMYVDPRDGETFKGFATNTKSTPAELYNHYAPGKTFVSIDRNTGEVIMQQEAVKPTPIPPSLQAMLNNCLLRSETDKIYLGPKNTETTMNLHSVAGQLNAYLNTFCPIYKIVSVGNVLEISADKNSLNHLINCVKFDNSRQQNAFFREVANATIRKRCEYLKCPDL